MDLIKAGLQLFRKLPDVRLPEHVKMMPGNAMDGNSARRKLLPAGNWVLLTFELSAGLEEGDATRIDLWKIAAACLVVGADDL